MIDGIYAAAAGEDSWDRTIAGICRLGRFDACTLSSVDRLDRRPFVLSAHGHRPSVLSAPGILAPNPLLTDSVLDSAPGAIWRDHEVMPPAVLRTTSFWSEWMLPNRFVHWAAMILGKRDELVVCLEFYACRDPFAPEAAHCLAQLAPHLARAWRLDEALRRSSRTQRTARAEAAPDADDRAGVIRLRAEFGLTRAEARLALALADGKSLAEAAERFQRKRTTIRSQLQQIFAKTGTSRQAELVALLLGRDLGLGPAPGWTPHGAAL